MPVKFKIAFIILLLLLNYTIKAQVSTTIKDNEYDSELLTKLANADFEKQEKSKVKANENLLYLYEISLDKGIHIPFSNNINNFLDGTLYSIQGAYFMKNTPNWGIRSGLSYTDGFSGIEYYIGVPVLLSYRTNITELSFYFEKEESFTSILKSFIVNIIPKRFEFSLGPNISYIKPDGYKSTSGYKVIQRMVLSIDASTRMSFKIWRFSLVLSPAVSYLATRNFKYYTNASVNYTKSQPAFFFKGTFGLSFRF